MQKLQKETAAFQYRLHYLLQQFHYRLQLWSSKLYQIIFHLWIIPHFQLLLFRLQLWICRLYQVLFYLWIIPHLAVRMLQKLHSCNSR